MESSVDSRCWDSVCEYVEVGEITEAIRSFAGAVYDIGWSDAEIDLYASELESICQRLQTVAPFVFYGEAVATFRRYARRDPLTGRVGRQD